MPHCTEFSNGEEATDSKTPCNVCFSRRFLLQAAGIIPLVQAGNGLRGTGLLGSTLFAAQTSQALPVPGETLAEVLKNLPWQPYSGSLFAVGAETVARLLVPSSPTQLDHQSSSVIQSAVQPFGRMEAQLGSLTAIVPATMVTFPEQLPLPDIFRGIPRSQRLLYFLSTLSPAQWQQLGAAHGIGVRDLRNEQLGVFESLIPRPFQQVSFVSTQERPAVTSLTKAQREQVRLRLNLDVRSGIGVTRDGSTNPLSLPKIPIPDPSRPGAFKSFALSELNTPREDGSLPEQSTVFGVTFRQITANTLKPGQLDFADSAWRRTVTPVSKESVGKLLERVGALGRAVLYVSPQLADLPIWYRGGSVVAADLLKAVCLAVTGTFRFAGINDSGEPVYVLTHSLEGIGQFQARVGEWIQDAVRQSDALMAPPLSGESDAMTRIWQAKPLQYLTFAPNDPFTVEPSLLSEWVKAASSTVGNSDDVIQVPLSAFGSFVQDALQTRGIRVEPERKVPFALNVQLYFILPAKTEATYDTPDQLPAKLLLHKPQPTPATAINTAASLAEPVSLKPVRGAKVLLLSASTSADALQGVTLAKKHGFSAVWIRLPDSGGLEIIQAAVQEGRKQNISVTAELHCLSRLPSKDKGTVDTVEINILGETTAFRAQQLFARDGKSLNADVRYAARAQYVNRRDWLRVDAPATLPQVVTRIREVASVDGLAGISFIDTVAPGYNFLSVGITDLGYHQNLRLRLLSRGGGDPIDLFEPSGYKRMRLPFFPEDSMARHPDGMANQKDKKTSVFPRDLWDTVRRDASISLLTNIYKQVKEAHPSLPLLVRDCGENILSPHSWYGSWDVVSLPPSQVMRTDRYPDLTDARASSRTAYVSLCWQNRLAANAPQNASQYRAHVGSWLAHLQQEWDGIVLDMTPVSVGVASALLQDIDW